MKRLVVVGTAWGDEGKGKITDFLSQYADITARYQGANNAGHSVSVNNKSHYFQSLPSGAMTDRVVNLITNGALVDPKGLLTEIKELDNPGLKLFISDKCHVIFPHNRVIEELNEQRKGENKLKTTGHAIGPTYSDKMDRVGIRMGVFVSPYFKDEFKRLIDYKNEQIKNTGLKPFEFEKTYEEYQRYADLLRPHVIDTSRYLNKAVEENKRILFEGAQGIMLCIENGTYPYVTSSSPTPAAVPLCTGLAPWLIDGAVGVVKSYVSREGAGPMPTLIKDENVIKTIYKANSEFEQRTKSYRRIGWFDSVLINHGKRVGGLSYLAVTVLDALTGLDKIKVCVAYRLNGQEIDYVPSNLEDFLKVEPVYLELPGWNEDISHVKSFSELPLNAQNYLKKIEELTNTPIAIFSVGPKREQTILVKELFD